MSKLAQLRYQLGGLLDAETAAGHTWGSAATRRRRAGDLAGEEDAYRRMAAAGAIGALDRLAGLRERAGDKLGAERIRRFGITAEGLPADNL